MCVLLCLRNGHNILKVLLQHLQFTISWWLMQQRSYKVPNFTYPQLWVTSLMTSKYVIALCTSRMSVLSSRSYSVHEIWKIFKLFAPQIRRAGMSSCWIAAAVLRRRWPAASLTVQGGPPPPLTHSTYISHDETLREVTPTYLYVLP